MPVGRRGIGIVLGATSAGGYRAEDQELALDHAPDELLRHAADEQRPAGAPLRSVKTRLLVRASERK